MENNVQGNVNNNSTASHSERSLCTQCYEFFGNPINDNLCSKCFNEVKTVKEAPKIRSKPQISPEQRAESRARLERLIGEVEALGEPESFFGAVDKKEEKQEEVVAPKQSDKSKCWKCTRKVGVLGFACKCDFTFCKLHRLPEDHDCNFDFVKVEREKLKQANPLVVASKLQKL